MIHDCTPPPERPVPAIIRHIHNILHPHHKRQYVAVRPLMCGEPDLEEVVVEAQPDPPPIDVPYYGTYPTPYTYGGPGIDSVVGPGESVDPRHGPQARYSVPEPGTAPLLVLGMLALALWLGGPRARR